MAQLNKEKQSALQSWRQACVLTDAALIGKSRAEGKLKQFDSWLKKLDPDYRSRYQIPLYFRRAKFEDALRLAKQRFSRLNCLEVRFIKRLIALERLKSALTLKTTKP